MYSIELIVLIVGNVEARMVLLLETGLMALWISSLGSYSSDSFLVLESVETDVLVPPSAIVSAIANCTAHLVSTERGQAPL
jgi:hypothetical protein